LKILGALMRLIEIQAKCVVEEFQVIEIGNLNINEMVEKSTKQEHTRLMGSSGLIRFFRASLDIFKISRTHHTKTTADFLVQISKIKIKIK
jgi:hypothetical protein